MKETTQYIKEKIQENLSPERTINLFHCLNELGDISLIEEVQRYLSSGSLSAADLSPAQWSALAFVFLMSDMELDVFDLKKYIRSDEGLQSYCLSVCRLSGCRVTEEGCSSLASALRSNPSHLRELDLSDNDLQDSGVKLLSAGLGDSHCALEILSVDHSGKCRTTLGIQKYSCQLTLDPNTAHGRLSLSEGNRKVTWGAWQAYPDHPERFYSGVPQVLCRVSLTGRCYWEADWSGDGVLIGVTYKGIGRKGVSADCVLGANDKSWSLSCSSDSYSVCHNNKRTVIPIEPSGSRRVGVYLDWAAGTLSFYRVSSDGLTLLCSFTSSFTEPLCPGFGIYTNCSVSLCMLG
uniref:B30.2/SPRY domain-containing protein n=1 Tax=Paramormyrops kingsleyae TaxID=1676925 RepID=A0A3B3S329_9TELE